ncbi:MAG: hypothetical protein H6R10_694 [Rhodocyclaceae bacterium]|nr:hypothetical protein [Rhodocyclaceae bacterium]
MSYGVELRYASGSLIFGPGDIGTTIVGALSAPAGASGSLSFPELAGVSVYGVAIPAQAANGWTQHVHYVSASYDGDGVPTLSWTASGYNGNMDSTIYVIAK